jgi:Ca-activated chloride channel family protein
MYGLAGGDTSLTGQFARFRNREQVSLLTFSDQVQDLRSFEISTEDSRTVQEIEDFIATLEADGKTAIFSTLIEAYDFALRAREQDPERYYSIVLLSDGENTTGASLGAFRSYYGSRPETQAIKTFTILFGEADFDTMQDIAEITGGRMFDAKSEALNLIFKEIRGYQ